MPTAPTEGLSAAFAETRGMDCEAFGPHEDDESHRICCHGPHARGPGCNGRLKNSCPG